MRIRFKTLVALAVTVAAVGLSPAAAYADPPPPDKCDSHLVSGNSAWAACASGYGFVRAKILCTHLYFPSNQQWFFGGWAPVGGNRSWALCGADYGNATADDYETVGV